MCAALFAGTGAFAAEIYKWVDENGVTHYSDQPHPKAQKLEVQPAQTFQSTTPAPSATTPSASSAQAGDVGPVYSVCQLSRPENDEVFMNTWTVPATVRLSPAQLRNGDRVVLALDGQRLTNQPPRSTTFVLNNVERGTHTLTAWIEDARGQEICRSSGITFHVRQPSVLAPNPANRPRF
jgi:hypothetical protein